MDIFKIIGIGLIATVLTILIKVHRPEFGMLIPIIAAAAIFMIAMPYLKAVISMFDDMAQQVGISSAYLTTVIKIIGVAYACEFASEVCRDVGESAIASKIEFGGKIVIITLSMPIVYQMLSLVSTIINF